MPQTHGVSQNYEKAIFDDIANNQALQSDNEQTHEVSQNYEKAIFDADASIHYLQNDIEPEVTTEIPESTRTAAEPISFAAKVDFIVQSTEEASAAAIEAQKSRFKRREEVTWALEQPEGLEPKHLIGIVTFIAVIAWFCTLQAKARAQIYEDALKRGYRRVEHR